MRRRLALLIGLTAVFMAASPVAAGRATTTRFTVDDTYLMSDVSVYPCSFPVLIHEVTKGTVTDFSNGSQLDFMVRSTAHYTMTNTDSGLTIEAFSPATIFNYDDFVVVENTDGTVTVSFSDKTAGLNMQVKANGKVTNLAGLSLAQYTFVFNGFGGELLSFTIDLVNTPHQDHASATICALLAPSP